VNYFQQCGNGCEHNTEADSDSTVEEDDAFHKEWIGLGAVKDVNFSSYAPADSDLSMCPTSSINESCTDSGGGGAVKRKREVKVSPNQYWVLLRYTLLSKHLSHSFMCTTLASVMNRIFST
jgi:hypothetical protein